MSGLRLGSLCSGYRGLDTAVEEVFGATTAWVSDIDPGANQILAHHWPATPNIGDLTTADWQRVIDEHGRPNIVCGGYPCQPFSLAGDLRGTADERHIWPHIAGALGVLRPRYAVFENVANHLRVGFDVVLADLAGLGFDVEWCLVRADEVGAPHQRKRLIVLASAADAEDVGHEWGGGARRGGAGSSDDGGAAADAHSEREAQEHPGSLVIEGERPSGRRGSIQLTRPAGSRNAGSGATTGEPTSNESAAAVQSSRGGADAWGRFAPAIGRWEHILGRSVPRATDDLARLSPVFVEWMMGLPAGHVTEVPGLTRNQQLKALGNGVVPQQAAAALRLLLERSTARHQLAA